MRSLALKALFPFTLLLTLALPVSVLADTLFISPASGSYGLGETFTVRVLVSSPRQAINALSGTVSFPTDKLQVTSVSKIGSILSLWVQEPSFSNSRGTVTFEGVVPNPGFSESNGRVLSITFKVVGTGIADVKLSSGSLLANDGYGTNVLKTLGSGSYSLQQKEVTPVTPPAILETGEDTEGSKTPVTAPNVQTPPQTKTVEKPSWEAVYAWLFKILSIVIPLVALIYFLIMTFHRGNQSVRRLRKNVRRDLHDIDRLIEKSFDILKEDISDSIHILERARVKRRLTAEEDAIIHRLRQNLVDAEKIIHKEVLQAERDIGD